MNGKICFSSPDLTVVQYLIVLPTEKNLDFYLKNIELFREDGKKQAPRFKKNYFSLKSRLNSFPELKEKIFYLENNSFLSENFKIIQDYFNDKNN